MNKDMSETLTRVGPGTRMGNLMRRFWLESQGASDINLERYALTQVAP